MNTESAHKRPKRYSSLRGDRQPTRCFGGYGLHTANQFKFHIIGIYVLTEVVITSTKKVTTDSSDIVRLGGVGEGVEGVEQETLLAEVLEHRR